MKPLRVLIALVALCTTSVIAQTAAELLVVTSIIGTLDSSVRLPSGSFQVANPKITEQFTNLLGADKAKYEGYTLYVATGLASKLADAYVANLANNFAAAGYFENSRSAQPAPTGETRTRIEYQNFDNGKSLLVYLLRQPDRVYFLVAKKK
ncbi:MAG: hypothetical protein ACK41E_08125 [Deinococcales bacterium]